MIELVKTFQILQAVGHDKFDPYAYQPVVPFVFINFFLHFMPGQPILMKWNWSAGPEKSEPLCLSTADTDILFDHFNLFILTFILNKSLYCKRG